jgi:acyl-CoA thioesterase-1
MLKIRHCYFLFLVTLLSILLVHPVQASVPRILVLGDSLSSGYGIDVSEGWVNLLSKRLKERGFPHQVVNASISGDTSGGGLARLPAALERSQPDIVILELGGNDGLRGLSLKTLKGNLAAMIELCRQAGAQVMLAEMQIPPNYGPQYTEKFQSIYTELTEHYDVTLIPFLLHGIAGNPVLMQEDGIHARAESQPLIVDNVWPVLRPLLER